MTAVLYVPLLMVLLKVAFPAILPFVTVNPTYSHVCFDHRSLYALPIFLLDLSNRTGGSWESIIQYSLKWDPF
jgi:hypothetical protein